MADDTSNRGPADAKRINVNEDHEVRYWTKKLGVSAEKLREAVQAAGTMAADVEKHLRSS
ncbi:MAG: DUF3606 domain-containing protein [Polyangiaceae bacterium]